MSANLFAGISSSARYALLMNNTLLNVSQLGDPDSSTHIGVTTSVIPQAKAPMRTLRSVTGVSTIYAPKAQEKSQWYVLRTTYGREKRAYDYLVSHGVTAFYPTIFEYKIIKGEKKRCEVSRLPNIFFAFGTEEELKTFVYDNINLPFLRFYYKQQHVGSRVKRIPLVVPEGQMRSLQIICESENDIRVIPPEITKFQTGQMVKVIGGEFAGIEGRVSRYHGQQRVAIVIDGLLTIATAYVPTIYLELINN